MHFVQTVYETRLAKIADVVPMLSLRWQRGGAAENPAQGEAEKKPRG